MLFDKYKIKSIALFGSITRNDFNEKSDIDILVDLESNIGIKFIDLAIELEALLGKKVDLVSKNGIKPKYLKTILPEVIYV